MDDTLRKEILEALADNGRDISYDDFTTELSDSFLDVASKVLGEDDEAVCIERLRGIAGRYDIGIGDALLVESVAKDPEVDVSVANLCVDIRLQELFPGKGVEGDENAQHAEVMKGKLAAVADALPDSKCAEAYKIISKYDGLNRETEAVRNEPDGPDREGKFANLQIQYEDVDFLLFDLHERLTGEVPVSKAEQSYVDSYLIANQLGDSSLKENTLAILENYASDHPDSVAAEIVAAEKVHPEDGIEALREGCVDAMFGELSVEEEEPDEYIRETDPIIGSYDLDKHDYATMPKDIRDDARVVINYAAAERLYATRDEFPSFQPNDVLKDRIEATQLYVDLKAEKGGILCKEISAIDKELDRLGPHNDYVPHDRRIDYLVGRKEDIVHFAGAVMAGTFTEDIKAQHELISEHHELDHRLRFHDREPDMDIDSVAQVHERVGGDIASYTAPTSPDTNGPAANYWYDFQRRNEFAAQVPEARATYEREQDAKTSLELYRVENSRDIAQEHMDLSSIQIDIYNEGVERFGVVYSPVAVEDKPLNDVETPEPQAEPDPAADMRQVYDEAKEKFENDISKYGFSNFFVAYDRLMYDKAAYETGLDGSRGHPVNGGDLMLDFIAWSRTNLIESYLERMLIDKFAEKYPGVDLSKDSIDRGEVVHSIFTDDTTTHDRDVDRVVYDNGFIDRGYTAPDNVVQHNPGFGRFMGADMTTRDMRDNDVSRTVRFCGSSNVETAITTGRVDVTGKMIEIPVPPIRLVSIETESGRTAHYLVDPWGQTVYSNRITDKPDMAISSAIESPYFPSLDISRSHSRMELLQNTAALDGVDVEAKKAEVTREVKEMFVERGLENISLHDAYIGRELLPAAMHERAAVNERIEYLQEAKAALEYRYEHPLDESQMIHEDYKEYAEFLGDAIGKLWGLADCLDDRVDSLDNTRNLYADVKDTCRGTTDVDTRFIAVVKADSQASGKLDTPYYGVTLTDLRSIDTALEACGFESDESLVEIYRDARWPEPPADIDDLGIKHDFYRRESNLDDADIRSEVREALELNGVDVEKDYPGLSQEPEKEYGVVMPRSSIREVLIDAGILKTDAPVTKEEVLNALDRYIGISEKYDSTYQFTTDFLEPNKDRIDPDVLIDAYREKLTEFADRERSPDVNMPGEAVSAFADCLASAKDQMVEAFTDAVSDKIDEITRDVIDEYDNERIDMFVNKLADAFEPVTDHICGIDLVLADVHLNDTTIERLESLTELGANDEQIDTITQLAKVVDAVFDGFSEILIHVYDEMEENDSSERAAALDDAKLNITQVLDAIDAARDYDPSRYERVDTPERDDAPVDDSGDDSDDFVDDEGPDDNVEYSDFDDDDDYFAF